jgi:uncharacterized protein YdiU (UPF0061 family)
MRFDNSFQTLPIFFYTQVKPTPILNPKLIHVTNLKEIIGLDNIDFLSWLNGTSSLDNEQRIATRYAGHQFGHFAGQLGDGRALSLGEIIAHDKRYEIQTKGSGLTPFSRMGDGKAVIRSSVREYLCSEAMFGLNIPTSRVLALLVGDGPVYRESTEREAIVARVFESNLRFGHFEMAFYYKKNDELKALISYAQKTFFNNLSVTEMLTQIVTETAKLIAQWQSVGFCHGVMNTDNMSLLSFTLDYGPFGFLEDTNLNHICNHSDHEGRYSFSEQPKIALWNLERLLICFQDHVKKEELSKILHLFPETFENEYLRIIRLKLGFNLSQSTDYDLFEGIFRILDDKRIDYTFFFRQLSNYQQKKIESIPIFWKYYHQFPELLTWFKLYDERLAFENSKDDARLINMQKINPKYILRNYIAQIVIDDVEKNQSKKLQDWLNVFYNPFAQHPNFEEYSHPTPREKSRLIVSCSS